MTATIKFSERINQARRVLYSAKYRLSDLKPSEWTEQKRVLNPDVSSRPGPFRYTHTPYLREVVDCLSPYHPARKVAVKKGAQIGFSTGVIESGIGWIISENPGNILFMTGSPDLTEIAMNKKIDQMIDSCGIRHLIRASTKKKTNLRTGDTKKGKEFPGGSLIAGNASNHKLLRQISVRYGFIDDFDSIKKSSSQSGNTTALIETRFAAYRDLMKIFYISTPELKATSNIDVAFDKGDQRYYNIPCPCCGEYIVLHWSIEIEGTEKSMGGITWQLDDKGELDENSVGYTCQKCGGWFDESHKHDLMQKGYWEPTAEPKEPGFYSYHISSLYSPPGHDSWADYVRKYMDANPPQGRREDLWQHFQNTILGESYQHTKESPDANMVQSKIRQYKIGTVPEYRSIKDGNGKIVLLTCACDLNGVEEDARLDYEVVAWAETGTSYSVKHGSIGTFVPREASRKVKDDRERWTYHHNRQRSVWPELENVLRTEWLSDVDGKKKIAITGVDCGHYTQQAYSFIDSTNIPFVFGVRGDKEEKYRKFKIDMPLFKHSKEKPGKLFMLDVNYIKDLVADCINLTWDPRTGESQPPGYMNYPQPAEGLYSYRDFFKHYEAEHRTDEIKNGVTVGTRWVKKSSGDPNHFWDIYIYNFALKEIFAAEAMKETPYKKGTFADFAKYVTGKLA